jgi:hypothetical protein
MRSIMGVSCASRLVRHQCHLLRRGRPFIPRLPYNTYADFGAQALP